VAANFVLFLLKQNLKIESDVVVSRCTVCCHVVTSKFAVISFVTFNFWGHLNTENTSLAMAMHLNCDGGRQGRLAELFCAVNEQCLQVN